LADNEIVPFTQTGEFVKIFNVPGLTPTITVVVDEISPQFEVFTVIVYILSINGVAFDLLVLLGGLAFAE
jgi:hypothetical protein